MAVKTPLVLGSSGHPEQLQAADTITVSTSFTNTEQVTNGGGAAAVICTPVYISAADTFLLAQANAAATADVYGLVYDASIGAAASGSIATDGLVTATTGQWDAVTGLVGGLVAGTDYFLSATTAGRLTATAPTAAGQFNVFVGKAKSATTLSVSIRERIAL